VIKIILAEDDGILRDRFKNLLQKEQGINITGEASNVSEVLMLLKIGVTADIILADMSMPGKGVALIDKLKEANYNIKVIVLSMLDHEKYVSQAFYAGARGYLLKNVSADELIFATKHVYQGNIYLCSELTTKLLKALKVHNVEETGSQPQAQLSKRELQVLQLMAEGLTNTEISEELSTSRRTIEGHRQNLIIKTASRNTAALIKYAILNGIIQ
jgi:DNA-binding NarL/FixJ family response regulator